MPAIGASSTGFCSCSLPNGTGRAFCCAGASRDLAITHAAASLSSINTLVLSCQAPYIHIRSLTCTAAIVAPELVASLHSRDKCLDAQIHSVLSRRQAESALLFWHALHGGVRAL